MLLVVVDHCLCLLSDVHGLPPLVVGEVTRAEQVGQHSGGAVCPCPPTAPASARSGQSIAIVARKHGLSPSLLFRWPCRLRPPSGRKSDGWTMPAVLDRLPESSSLADHHSNPDSSISGDRRQDSNIIFNRATSRFLNTRTIVPPIPFRLGALGTFPDRSRRL